MEAVRVYTRYDLPNSKGQVRREINKRVGVETPIFEIPEEGYYLWEIFIEINNNIYRRDMMNGNFYNIPPSEFLAWLKLTGIIITPLEYRILQKMDAQFVIECNKELDSERENEKQKMRK